TKALVDHDKALMLSAAAIDKINGRLVNVEEVLKAVHFLAQSIVDCGFEFTPYPWGQNVFDWIDVAVQAGGGRIVGDIGQARKDAVDGVMLMLVIDPLVRKWAGKPLTQGLQADLVLKLKDPALAKEMASQSINCGISVTENYVTTYLGSVSDFAEAVRMAI